MKLQRTINPQIRVVSESEGLVDYIASDESVDSYQEVIRADGWRFTRFARNAPFIDSHTLDSIGRVLGRVVDFRVTGGRLIERVRWAVDVAENEVAQLGFRMTVQGYLRAVSVGFFPVRAVNRWDGDREEFRSELDKLRLDAAVAETVRTIYLEQEQIELSACVIGANPNALARAHREGNLSRRELATLTDFQHWQQEKALEACRAGTAAFNSEADRVAKLIARRAR